MQTDRILREPEVEEMTGLGRTTRYHAEKRGEFPRRRAIGRAAHGWLLSEILEWMESLPAGDVRKFPLRGKRAE